MEMVLEFLNCKPDVTTAMRNGQALLEVFLENTNILQKDRFRWNIPEWLSVGFRCLEQFLVVGANPNVTFHSQPFLHCCLESSSIVRKVTASRSFVLHLLEKADLVKFARYAPGGEEITSSGCQERKQQNVIRKERQSEQFALAGIVNK